MWNLNQAILISDYIIQIMKPHNARLFFRKAVHPLIIPYSFEQFHLFICQTAHLPAHHRRTQQLRIHFALQFVFLFSHAAHEKTYQLLSNIRILLRIQLRVNPCSFFQCRI